MGALQFAIFLIRLRADNEVIKMKFRNRNLTKVDLLHGQAWTKEAQVKEINAARKNEKSSGKQKATPSNN